MPFQIIRDDIEMTVTLVVFDEKAFRLSGNLFFQVESFIEDFQRFYAETRKSQKRKPFLVSA